MDAHEFTGENLKTIDESFSQFLEFFASDEEFEYTDILIH